MSTLRQSLKQTRAGLSTRYRRRCAGAAWRLLRGWPGLRHVRDVGCYLAVDAEFPTRYLIERLWRMGKRVYLPLLERDGSLAFQRYLPHTALRPNRFGIPEPLPTRRRQLPARRLQLVITPLLGFDAQGHRLGMGGGYYDRSFGFLLSRRRHHQPFLLGLAFQAQQVAEIPAQPWDVPLDGVLTESGLHIFNGRKADQLKKSW